jgi:hypothetical protein
MGPAQDRVHAGLELDRLYGRHQHLVRAPVQKLRRVGRALRKSRRIDHRVGASGHAQRPDPVRHAGHGGQKDRVAEAVRTVQQRQVAVEERRPRWGAQGFYRPATPSEDPCAGPLEARARITASLWPQSVAIIAIMHDNTHYFSLGYMNKVKNSKYREGAKRTRRRGSSARTQPAAPTGGSRRRPAHMLLKSALIMLAALVDRGRRSAECTRRHLGPFLAAPIGIRSPDQGYRDRRRRPREPARGLRARGRPERHRGLVEKQPLHRKLHRRDAGAARRGQPVR